MDKKDNFVKTSDENVAKELRNSGYVEIAKEGKYFVFLNSGMMNFSNMDNVIITNKLNL